MGYRFSILIGVASLGFLSLVLRLYGIQIEKESYYASQAEAQHLLAGVLEAERGDIYFTDKNGNLAPAVINKNFPVVFAVPEEVSDFKETAALLSSVLEVNAEEIERKLGKEKDRYEIIARKVSDEKAETVRKLKLKGIYVDDEKTRFYPLRKSASHFLGFVGERSDDKRLTGRYGLEMFYDSILEGVSGEVFGDRVVSPKRGKDVTLTVDLNVQSEAEKVLSGLIEKWRAKGGVAIVQEPKTGKIIAMAGRPAFDPNEFNLYNLEVFLNPATEKVYEPGSVFKVITMAAGIDSGKIAPDTTYIDKGSLVLNGKTIENWDMKAHGRITMTEVIEKSVNTGAVFAAKTTGYEKFAEYVSRFGFGEKTGVDLPGEVAGNLNNLRGRFREINFATASFGQGVAVTPLALINAVSAIANGGTLMRPYFNAELKPAAIRKVISSDAAAKVTAMMESAVAKAQVAAINRYRVAGKTGTAQVPNFETGGYSDKLVHTYVGFAPVASPRFTILIKLDEPEASLAGLTVVPAFKNFAQFILNYYNVPPDK